MEGVGPGGGPGSTGEDVGEDDAADYKAREPGGNGAAGIRKELRESSWDRALGGNLFASDSDDRFCRANDSNQEIGDDESDEYRKKKVAEALRFKAGAEILNLGDVAVALSDGPEFDADHEEAGCVDEARGGRHETIGSDAQAEGLTGGSHKCEGGHGGAEDRHQEHEGPDGVARDEIVLRSASKQGFGKEGEPEKEREINDDYDYGGHVF